MWLAALSGRLAYLIHGAGGHAVTWKTSPPDLPLCTGDIVCHDCGQVLWCRAHDPWRVVGRETPADHWGGTRAHHPPSRLFENLQHVLRLAEEFPSGPSGDEIRRAACELVEADSAGQRRTRRRRMLMALARLESRLSNGRRRNDDPSPLMLTRLTDALRRELWPG
jgi:hypothetical protein